MHPDHLRGALRARAELGDGDGARIRCEDRGSVGDAIEIGEERELELRLLGCGLDDQCGIGGALQALVGGDACERRVARGRVDELLLDLAREILLDGRARAIECGAGNVDHRHVETGHGEDVRYPVPHLPRSDDGDLLAHAAFSMRATRRRHSTSAATPTAIPATAAAPPSGPHAPPLSHVGPAPSMRYDEYGK